MLVRSFAFSFFIILLGCTPKLPFFNEQINQAEINTDESMSLNVEKILEHQNEGKESIDPRLKRISETPSLLASHKKIDAAKKNISIVQSQSEPNLSVISNIGPKLDNDEVELDASGGVSLTQLINDGGALNAMTEAAQLNVKVAKLDYIQSVNAELMKVLRAEQTILNFYKIQKIYQEQLAVYNENLPLIKTAAKANII